MRPCSFPRVVRLAAWIVGAGSMVGCFHAHTPLGSRGPARAPSTICPFGLRGVRVATDDVGGGIDVTLTTFEGDVEELRRRTHEALDRPDPERIAASHCIVDVDDGIVIRVRAIEGAQVDALRSYVRARIDAAGDPARCGDG